MRPHLDRVTNAGRRALLLLLGDQGLRMRVQQQHRRRRGQIFPCGRCFMRPGYGHGRQSSFGFWGTRCGCDTTIDAVVVDVVVDAVVVAIVLVVVVVAAAAAVLVAAAVLLVLYLSLSALRFGKPRGLALTRPRSAPRKHSKQHANT